MHSLNGAVRMSRALRFEDPGPTPETKAKLRPDMLKALYAAGHLSEEQWVSAQEIREINWAVSALWFRGNGKEGGGGSFTAPRHHLDAMPPNLLRPYKNRYLPWMRRMEALHMGRDRWSEVITGVLIDSREPSHYGVPEFVIATIKQGLDSY